VYTHSHQKAGVRLPGDMRLLETRQIAIITLLCAVPICWGQTGSISGEVRGRHGEPVQGALIKIERTDDVHLHSRTTTDKNGHYLMIGLPLVGIYEVTVEVSGKDERGRDGIRLRVGEAVTVNFSLEAEPLGPRERKLRAALWDVQSPDPLRAEQALKAIQSMADRKHPAAMYLIGKWSEQGYLVPKDPDKAFALLNKAAEANFSVALFEMGIKYVDGKHVPKDEAKGLELIRRGAVLGSVEAQFHLGASYEFGENFPKDEARARQYFRMCAKRGEALCQLRLALLQLKLPERTERDYLQALAWLELAAEHGLEGAATLRDRERPKLTANQSQWVARLKSQYNRGN
jgi:TPR repeat protein